MGTSTAAATRRLENGFWLEAPPDEAEGAWARHDVDPDWPTKVSTVAADVNGDGRKDMLVAASESEGRLVWYEAPADPRTGRWTRESL